MKKEKTRRETPEEIIRDVCGVKRRPRKKNRSLDKMVETDIDIFADENKLQIKEISKDVSD